MVSPSGIDVPEVARDEIVETRPSPEAGEEPEDARIPDELAGVVISTEAFDAPAPRNLWRMASLVLIALIGLPLLLLYWVVRLGLRLALSGLGIRGGGGGDGVLEWAVGRGISDLFLRPREQVPCYHFTIETPRGQVGARQEREFIDGRIVLGHRVRLRCAPRVGGLVILGGTNETLNQTLTLPPNRWKAAFWVLLPVVGVGLLAVLSAR